MIFNHLNKLKPFLFILIISFSFILIFSGNASAEPVEFTDYDKAEYTFVIFLFLMFTLLLISLRQPEWGILGGIVWILSALTYFIEFNASLGLIVISIGMLIMLYGVYELFRR